MLTARTTSTTAKPIPQLLLHPHGVIALLLPLGWLALVVITGMVSVLVPDRCTHVSRAHYRGASLAVDGVRGLCELAAQPGGVVGGRLLAKHLLEQGAQHWDT